MLEEEGPLDEGPGLSEREATHGRTASESTAAWSTCTGPGSPMEIEDR